MSDRIDHGAEPWKAIPRKVLRDPRLSARAKGGLVTILSHEDGWVRSVIGLLMRENAGCGRDQARAIMKELAELGYAERVRTRNSEGQFVSHYRVGVSAGSEGGTSRSPRPGEPEVAEPPTGNPSPEVEPQSLEPQDQRTQDQERLCLLLADLIEGNGVKRPTITAGWRDSARLMLARDGRSVGQVADVIRWAQADEFWRSNVLSMGTVRKQFDRLTLQMRRGNGARTSSHPTDRRVAQLLARNA